jgi:hypothetical protein
MLTPEVNKLMAQALVKERPVPKTPVFDQLLSEVGDEDMANVIWVYFSGAGLKVLDAEAPALSSKLSFRDWLMRKPKSTIRSLIKTEEGRQIVWRMLHDAGAWL